MKNNIQNSAGGKSRSLVALQRKIKIFNRYAAVLLIFLIFKNEILYALLKPYITVFHERHKDCAYIVYISFYGSGPFTDVVIVVLLPVLLGIAFAAYYTLRKKCECKNCGYRFSFQQILKMKSFSCPHCGITDNPDCDGGKI